ncbi:hypothetical protein pdam_00024705, partial [Pocillopora damicornis]
MSPFRVPNVGMKTFAISHAPVGDPHCCLSLLFQQIFGRGDLWRCSSSFFQVVQVAHLEEWPAQGIFQCPRGYFIFQSNFSLVYREHLSVQE